MIEPEARERLSRLMDERRLELRLRWREVAGAAGISYEAVRDVRNGSGEIRMLTQRGIEVALKWEPGSVSRILGGALPVLLVDEPAGPQQSYIPVLSADDAEIETYERQVRLEVSDALARHGAGAAGTQVFPASAVEASVWDTRRLPDREAKVRLVAKLRSIADEFQPESDVG